MCMGFRLDRHPDSLRRHGRRVFSDEGCDVVSYMDRCLFGIRQIPLDFNRMRDPGETTVLMFHARETLDDGKGASKLSQNIALFDGIFEFRPSLLFLSGIGVIEQILGSTG